MTRDMCPLWRFVRATPLVALLAPWTLGLLVACEKKDEACALPDDSTATPPGAVCALDSDCAAVKDQAPLCVAGICGLAPKTGTCAEEGTRSGCPAGHRCRINLVEATTS